MEGSTIILAVIFVATLLYMWRKQRPSNAAPGPLGLPYIGSMLDFVQALRKGEGSTYVTNLHKKYGPVAGIRAGVQQFLFIKDGKLLEELFNKEEFAFRPTETLPVLKQINNGTLKGLIFTNGEPNKEMRRFSLLCLKDFGVGKKSLDEMIQTEVSTLCQYMEDIAKANDGIVSGMKLKVQYATANIIHHIIFGHRKEYEDPKWRDLVQLLYDFFAMNPLAFPNNFLPIIDRIPYLSGYLTNNKSVRMIKIIDKLEEYLSEQIDQHRSTYVAGEIRDFIDFYLKYEKEKKEHYNTANIFRVMLDLFRAGSDTTATTLSWCIVYLIREPDIQMQLREEIDKVVGDQTFERKNKDKLIKTRAFINEIHRHVSVAQLAPPHSVTKNMEVQGMVIQPGELIFGSLYSMHHDKEYWGDPYTFRIDRWIDENGELLKHKNHFYPFSVGKRVCPGRQLANIELILILVEFMQRYTFEPAPGKLPVTENPAGGFLRAPEDYHFKLVKRC